MKSSGLKVRIVPIKDLVLDDQNPNRHTDRGRSALENSLKKYGAGRSVLVDKHNRVIAGNATVEHARIAGMKKIAVIEGDGSVLVAVQRADLDLKKDKKARELSVADNRVAELDLDWDPEVLAGLDLDLSQWWDDAALKKLLAEFSAIPQEAPEAEFNRSAHLVKKWKTKRGQVWTIGRHRMMCGDSSQRTDVSKLMGKQKARMMATDPPYGVGYGRESGPDSARRWDMMGADENDGPKLQRFLEGVFSIAVEFLESGSVWYLWHAQMTQGFFAAAAAAAQFRIHRQIIWSKSHFILGHGDFHWQHELCFYGWREGEKHRWFGGRDQSTVWSIDNPRAHKNHPTEKPTEIFQRSMQLNTKKGEICYEPFSGSGSQLCAAEIVGRTCYAMELEPQYVAVALERLSKMGLKPKLSSR